MNTNETPDARDTAGASAGGVLIERDGPVAILTLNRPKQLNALSVALRRDIVKAIRELSAATDVRAIVFTGNGRAFSAGVDLKEAGQQGFSLGTEKNTDDPGALEYADVVVQAVGPSAEGCRDRGYSGRLEHAEPIDDLDAQRRSHRGPAGLGVHRNLGGAGRGHYRSIH